MKRLQEKNITPIEEAQGQQLAQRISAIKYIECSALTQHNLKFVFEEAIRAVLARKANQWDGKKRKKKEKHPSLNKKK